MLRVENITVRAGEFQLANLSFTVEKGEYAVLMGPTGCGKTTLLEALCGLRRVARGEIYLGERDLIRTPVRERRIGYVPQDGALFPHLTVADNLAFPCRVRGLSATESDSRVARLANQLAIESLLNRSAQGLSGGETQRVALGRALASDPELLLLDEPLSALDEATREEMLQLLINVRRDTDLTTLHVTHRRSEAERLCRSLLTITEEGQLVQEGKPADRAADPPVLTEATP